MTLPIHRIGHPSAVPSCASARETATARASCPLASRNVVSDRRYHATTLAQQPGNRVPPSLCTTFFRKSSDCLRAARARPRSWTSPYRRYVVGEVIVQEQNLGTSFLVAREAIFQSYLLNLNVLGPLPAFFQQHVQGAQLPQGHSSNALKMFPRIHCLPSGDECSV